MKKVFLSVSLFFILFTSVLVKTSDASSWFFIKSAGGAFTPLSLSGLTQWMDASDNTQTFTDTGCTSAATADTDNVKCWKDKSGNGYHMTQGTTNPILKTAVKNSLNVIRFDGTNDILDTSTNISNLISTTAYSIWFVINMKAFNSNFTSNYYPNEGIWTEKTFGNIGLYGLSGGPLFGNEAFGNPSGQAKINRSAVADTWYIVHLRHDSGNYYMSVNNGTETSQAVNNLSAMANPSRFGCNYDTPAASTCSQVDFAEVVFSNATESAGNLTNMQTYLSTKWSIP